MRFKVVALLVMLALVSLPILEAAGEVTADRLNAYTAGFLRQAYAFGNRNRFNVANVNRDKHVDCYLEVKVQAAILQDGQVKEVVVKEPSPNPIFDRYALWVIKQAGPYPPLTDFFGAELEELVLEESFRLRLGLYEFSKIDKRCE